MKKNNNPNNPKMDEFPDVDEYDNLMQDNFQYEDDMEMFNQMYNETKPIKSDTFKDTSKNLLNSFDEHSNNDINNSLREIKDLNVQKKQKISPIKSKDILIKQDIDDNNNISDESDDESDDDEIENEPLCIYTNPPINSDYTSITKANGDRVYLRIKSINDIELEKNVLINKLNQKKKKKKKIIV